MPDDRRQMESVYRRRQALAGRYSLEIAGNRYNFERLCGRIEPRLKALFGDLSTIRALDLGAGEMAWTAQLSAFGLAAANCVAADILAWRLQNGRSAGRLLPAVAASAAQLPFPDGSFDLVVQMTMMTSVLDRTRRKEIAAEMQRVLRKGGYILWYDFRFNNPANPDTRAIGRREIASLFAGWPMQCEKMTLLPPLARTIGGLSFPPLKWLELLPILRTHYLAFIGPKE